MLPKSNSSSCSIIVSHNGRQQKAEGIIQDGDYIDLSKLSEKHCKIQQKLGLEKCSKLTPQAETHLCFLKPNHLFSNSKGLPEKIYNTEKTNRVRLHDPVEILEEAGSIV